MTSVNIFSFKFPLQISGLCAFIVSHGDTFALMCLANGID